MDRQTKTTIKIFIATQICGCSSNQDCCSAPGQTPQEIENITACLKKANLGKIDLRDIRDISATENYPMVVKFVKRYGYNALPIIIVGQKIVSYGISDPEFIIKSIGKVIENAN